MTTPSTLPLLLLKKSEERRLRGGHLWIYSNEVDIERTPLKDFAPGIQAEVRDSRGQFIGIAYVNPHSLICGRIVSRDAQQPLDQALLTRRLRHALALRETLFAQPCYRLLHGEGDNLPGLVVDRFNDVLVVQITTAGMEALKADILAALDAVVKPRAIVLRNDTAARTQEGLTEYCEVASGTLPPQVLIEENNTRFAIDVLQGQKTGWFYDHRMNRARLQHYVQGLRVLDVFSYAGAWGLQALSAGARSVLCVDASAPALAQVQANAALNNVDPQALATQRGDAFEVLKSLALDGERFDVVIVDPPAFIKRKKDVAEGLVAYQRINQLAMALLSDKGYLISGSCSFHLGEDQLRELLQKGARQFDNGLQILEQGQQGPDHPWHPAIPETRYLKAYLLRRL